MKRIILSAMCLLPAAVMAQSEFNINGNVKGLKTGDKIYLIYNVSGNNKIDSSNVKNGLFSFKGSVTDPVRGNLFLNINPLERRPAKGEKADALSFYLEPGKLMLSAPDSLKNIKIAGSAINDDDKRLKASLKPVEDQLTAINTEYAKLSDEQRKDKDVVEALRERYMKAADGLAPLYLEFAKQNPKSYLALPAIAQLVSDPEKIAEAEKVYAAISPKWKASKLGKDLAATFNAAKKTGIGVEAMDFTQNDPNGKPVKLSDFRGKFVLLDFWASWCGPCRAENPNVVSAYNNYKDKNFTVLGVSLDKPGQKDAWLKAIADDNLTWTHVSDLKFWDNEVSKMYGVRSIPANFLIDPSGKIIAKDVRGEELQQKLAEVLGK